VISEFNITIKSGDGCPRLFMPTLYVVVLGVNRIGKVVSKVTRFPCKPRARSN
jgi:hypothetical protein